MNQIDDNLAMNETEEPPFEMEDLDLNDEYDF